MSTAGLARIGGEDVRRTQNRHSRPDRPRWVTFSGRQSADQLAASRTRGIGNFFRSGSTWLQQAYLNASNTDASDAFGYSVALSGDTVVIGAVGEASNATGMNGDQSNNLAGNAGASYLFSSDGSSNRIFYDRFQSGPACLE